MRRLLVLAPHADDAEFGVGAMLHRLAGEGDTVSRVTIFACGSYVRSDGCMVTGDQRRRETAEALALLGTKASFAGAFLENEADQMPFKDLVDSVEAQIDLGTDSVCVCLPSFNQDHTRLFEATMTALRPGHFDGLREIWAYEYPGNSWGPPTPSHGHCYVRVSFDDMSAKAAALDRHESQFKDRPAAHVSPAGAWQLARLRGSECGTQFAERLYLLRGLL